MATASTNLLMKYSSRFLTLCSETHHQRLSVVFCYFFRFYIVSGIVFLLYKCQWGFVFVCSRRDFVQVQNINKNTMHFNGGKWSSFSSAFRMIFSFKVVFLMFSFSNVSEKRIILIVEFFSSLKGDIMNYFSLLIAVLLVMFALQSTGKRQNKGRF